MRVRTNLRRLARSGGYRLRLALARALRARPNAAAWVLGAVRLVPARPLRTWLLRSFSWRLAHELSLRLEVETIGGRMSVDTSDEVGRVLAVSGVWEPNITDTVRRMLSPGDVCIDVGAHTGYYTLVASQLVGNSGHVYAFEPSPERYAELCANLERNAVTNVTTLEVAAGAEAGTASLYLAPTPNTSASSMSVRALEAAVAGGASDSAHIEVEVGAVDSFVPRSVFPRIRLIKVDVEGYELEVLRGLERILECDGPIALVVEVTPAWTSEDPGPAISALCRRHRLTPWLLANDYTPEAYFPTRLQPPVLIDSIATEKCDVLLTRDVDVSWAEADPRSPTR